MINYFLKNKITAIMLYLALMLLGVISLKNLKIDLLPDISFPTLTVITVYENVSPMEIETLITKPIEEIVASVGGVDRVTSDSIEGVSIVKVRFRWGTDMDQASIQMREKVDLVKGTLPIDAKKSIVLKFDPNSAPIMQIAVEPAALKLQETRGYLKKNILPYLERIDGVAAISISGGYERQIQVFVDRGKLEAYSIGITDLVEKISSNNFNYPAGNIREGDKELLVRTAGSYKSVISIGDTVVGKSKAGIPTYLSDLAIIKDDFKEKTSSSYFNGKEVIALTLKKEAGKNTIAVAKEIQSSIDELNDRFGSNLKFHVVSDQSVFIEEAVGGVSSAGIQAAIICYFILLYFLGTWKEPLLVVIAIPISITITFILMNFQNLTLNTMSLGGLAIGVGMVVDSGTVVLESIYEKKNTTKNLYEACLLGTKEVLPSVISSTITSIVVFLPILFVEGIAGAIFKEFALTITYSLIASCFVSLTLIPVLTLSPFFMEKEKKSHSIIVTKFMKVRSNSLNSLENWYEELMLKAYKHKKLFIISTLAVIPTTILLFTFLPKELMPDIDRGEITLKLVARPGTPLVKTNDLTEQLTSMIESKKMTESIFSKIGFEDRDLLVNPRSDFGLNRSEIFIRLIPSTTSLEFIENMKEDISAFETRNDLTTSLTVSKSLLGDILSTSSADLSLEISGEKLEDIKEVSESLHAGFIKNEDFTDVSSSFLEEVPEYRIILDRDKMGFFNLSIQDVAVSLKAAVKGEIATKYREKDTEIGILVRLHSKDRLGINSLDSILIPTQEGFNIKLSSIGRIELAKVNRKIQRYDGKRVGLVSLNFGEKKYSDVISMIQPEIQKFEDRKDLSILYGELDKETNRSIRSLLGAVILAIILVYMVLASQFEDLTLPFLIMTSILLSGIGSALGLLLTGNSLNIISLMGIVMLSGIVVNNAIILVETFRLYSDKKVSVEKITIEAGKRRIRPILNTTTTTILGMLPMLITFGRPSPQGPMAAALIGGLFFSTLLTLFFVPVGYSLILQRASKKY
ncbi:efflux RND transporter permease subunit [Leptospira sp. 'Mane']|uniref:efflux RND transporter permease subunit n=1 Tax=Leptospira sp. 'Mane' TaxID=3387407 RepID=UPI00398BA2E5